MPAAKTPSRTGRPIGSEIWQHFTKESPTLVRCNRCPKGFKRPSPSDSTTKFWNHLRLHHLDVFVTTRYCINKRVSRPGGPAGNGAAAKEVAHTQVAPVANASSQRRVSDVGNEQAQAEDKPADFVDSAQDFAVSDAADNEQSEDPASQAMDDDAASIPEAQIENEPALGLYAPFDMILGLQAQQLRHSLFQPPHIAAPQPLPIPAQQVQAVENDLVETSGRAIIMRLRQLHEKDAKLFLRAQNDINNVIFKYEMEGM